MPSTQTVDFEVGGKFKPDTINFVNDKLTVIDQQIKTLLKQRGLLYSETAFLDASGKDNALPVLPAQTNTEIPIWSKDKNNNLIATVLEEAGDLSNLRAELESEAEASPGAELIGYFDEFDCNAPVGKTINELMKQIAPLIDCRIAAVNEADPTKKLRFDLSDLDPNTTAVLKIHNQPAGSIPTGGIIIWPTETPPDGFLECNGQDIDLRSDTAPPFALDLFLAIGTRYGVGSQVYEPDRVTIFPPNEQNFFAMSMGAPTTPPSPGSTGFTINVIQPGSFSLREAVKIVFVAGNVIPAGAFFTLHSPKGDRKSIVWYEVDGNGTAPVEAGAFISKVSILSTDSAQDVRDKTKFAFSGAQYKVPDLRDMIVRGYHSSTAQNPAISEIQEIVNIANGGLNYQVNDIVFTADPTTLFPCEMRVETVVGGAVDSIRIINRGRFIGAPAPSQVMFGGSGSGLVVDIGSEFFDPGKDERISWPWTSSDEAEDPNIIIGPKIGSYQADSPTSFPDVFPVPPTVANYTTGGTIVQALSPETRPKNIYQMYIIKT